MSDPDCECGGSGWVTISFGHNGTFRCAACCPRCGAGLARDNGYWYCLNLGCDWTVLGAEELLREQEWSGKA